MEGLQPVDFRGHLGDDSGGGPERFRVKVFSAEFFLLFETSICTGLYISMKSFQFDDVIYFQYSRINNLIDNAPVWNCTVQTYLL